MCGIFGYIGEKKNAGELVFNALKSLEYRGYDSWGVAVVPLKNTSKIIVKKKTGKIGTSSIKELPGSSFAFGHTRWATHGGITQKNAHPHLDCTQSIAIVHNGIIENYADIKQTLLSKGHTFVSDTDSEVAVHLIEELRLQYPFQEAVRKAFLQCNGFNALIAIETKSYEFVAIRNGSPLVMGFGENENMLASDTTALLPFTKDVYFLKDDEMVAVAKENAFLFDVKTGKSKKIIQTRLMWNIESAEKGEYKHFMLKEIYEQPRIISSVSRNGLLQARELADFIKKSYGTYFVGCGTASYACIAATYLFSKIAKRHINYAIGSEFSYHLDFLTSRSLVIALSQSGETMDILESVKEAKKRKARIVSLVNAPGSTLYRESHKSFLIGAGPEKGVASTKAFIGKISHLLFSAYVLAGKEKEGKDLLEKASKAVQKILTPSVIRHVQTVVSKLRHARHLYVVGRGLSYPASLEIALKIKEISYIHAEGIAAGEIKHGPLALITKGTPCIVVAPLDETYDANLAAAMEMKARGGYIVGISPVKHEVFDDFLKTDDVGDASIIPSVVYGQLMGYYLALIKKRDPDKPRNLAKSVTVK